MCQKANAKDGNKSSAKLPLSFFACPNGECDDSRLFHRSNRGYLRCGCPHALAVKERFLLDLQVGPRNMKHAKQLAASVRMCIPDARHGDGVARGSLVGSEVCALSCPCQRTPAYGVVRKAQRHSRISSRGL